MLNWNPWPIKPPGLVNLWIWCSIDLACVPWAFKGEAWDLASWASSGWALMVHDRRGMMYCIGFAWNNQENNKMHTPGIEPRTCASKAFPPTIYARLLTCKHNKQIKPKAKPNIQPATNARTFKRASHMLPHHHLLHWFRRFRKILLPTDVHCRYNPAYFKNFIQAR